MSLRRASIAALVLALSSAPHAALSKPAEEPSGAAAKGQPAKVAWLSFDAATARAAAENKHLIVDIYATWCGWCKIMERQTYGNPEVASYLTENFVLAKVNGESSAKLKWKGKEITERQFARQLGVTGYPATYFLKPNADLLGGVPGFIKSPDFMIYARYVNTRWYEKGKIQEYVDSLRVSAK